ncbi:hypothetical protein [Nonomuraea sp. CA-141351]|uniref:hypothetical protein n=1 Tax=Nonomuraea sp. CA-141351 TaxID=3239996 RepID=UPI003D8BECC1
MAQSQRTGRGIYLALLASSRRSERRSPARHLHRGLRRVGVVIAEIRPDDDLRTLELIRRYVKAANVIGVSPVR